MAPRPGEVVAFVLRSSRRIAVSVVGAALVVAGLAMVVLPGPGLLVVVAGFAVLGTEYAWAAAALERTKRTAARAGRAAGGAARRFGRRPRP
ncbi:MAG: PGPGW domain-containing protein [Acidimicrobiia bacterium]